MKSDQTDREVILSILLNMKPTLEGVKEATGDILAANFQRPTVDKEAWEAVKKTTDALNYIKGIIERGIGHPLEDDVTVENAVLNYVKKLEANQHPPASSELIDRVKQIKYIGLQSDQYIIAALARDAIKILNGQEPDEEFPRPTNSRNGLTGRLVEALKSISSRVKDAPYASEWNTDAIDALIAEVESHATPEPVAGRMISEDEIKALAHEEMLEYVDMGSFKDWELALHLLEEGFFFGYSNAFRSKGVDEVLLDEGEKP